MNQYCRITFTPVCCYVQRNIRVGLVDVLLSETQFVRKKFDLNKLSFILAVKWH